MQKPEAVAPGRIILTFAGNFLSGDLKVACTPQHSEPRLQFTGAEIPGKLMKSEDKKIFRFLENFCD